MIAAAVSSAVSAWAEQAGLSFEVDLLADTLEPHDAAESGIWRARLGLVCEITPPWTVKTLGRALNEWLARSDFHSAVVVDAAPLPPGGRAAFDVAVWHRGAGQKSETLPLRTGGVAQFFRPRISRNFFPEEADDG